MSSVNARVPPLRLMAVDTPSNGQIPSYQSSSGQFEWVDDSSGGTPGGSADEIQYNDGSGGFAADSAFKMNVKGNGDTTKVQVGNLIVGAGVVETASANGFVTVACDGTGQIFLQSGAGKGGTWTDSIVNINKNATSDNATIRFRDNGASQEATIKLDGSGNLDLDNENSNQNIEMTVKGTGQIEVKQSTTNNDSNLLVRGNGTGTPKVTFTNDTKAITVQCDENNKLKVQGALYDFIFDCSTSSGGITFPDGTTQTTAASGGGATELSELSDVLIDATNFTDSFLIQPNSNGSAPTTGGLSGASFNVGIGYNVFQSITSGDTNVGFGYIAGQNITTGGGNILVGGSAGVNINTGSNNTCIGKNTGIAIQGGQRNTCLGYNAGKGITSGTDNLAIHRDSLINLQTGNYNIGIGRWNGRNLTTGSGNVYIGNRIDASSSSADRELVIQGDNNTSSTAWITADSTGSCYQGDNSSTWSTTSDRRLKTNISDIDSMLEKINQVGVKTFNYIEKAEAIIETEEDGNGEIIEKIVGYEGENRYNLDPEPTRVGVIAQELQEIFPDAVKENSFGHLTVNPDSIHWALIKAVQELTAKVEELEAQLG